MFSLLSNMRRALRSLLTRGRDRRLKERLEEAVAGGGPVKLVVGAESTDLGPDWHGTNLSFLDVTRGEDWERLFRGCRMVTHVLAEHVFEHLTQEQGKQALAWCRRHLSEGGRVRIAVPDGFNPNEAYIEHVRPGGCGPGAEDHKVLYDVESLTGLLEGAGFRAEPLEWHDRQGVFHEREWSAEDGKVFRSRAFGEENRSFPSSHLSLIVDGMRREEGGSEGSRES